nr:glycoside hydrolase domain-containing protein [uncultured Flavobacterium sp.]
MGSVTESNGTYNLDGSSNKALILFKNIEKKVKIKGQFTLGNAAGSAGFVFQTNDAGSYYKIAFEPSKGKIAGYNSASQEVTRIPFKFQSGVKYDVEIIAEGSVCILYINGKAALSNRIYGRDKNKWGMIAEGQSFIVSDLQVSKPK